MALSREFTDPRLVAVYDTVNAYAAGTQPDFYLNLAADVGARTVVEVGCGTGLVSERFVRRGYDVVGVEPAPAMLQVARDRLDGERARWIRGDVAALAAAGVCDADLAFLAGHVAQFFLTDAAWYEALQSLHRVLRPGGWLAFESRNPAAREWESWTPTRRRTVVDDTAGPIEVWTEVDDVSGPIVTGTLHYLFHNTGEELTAPGSLRFWDLAELDESLARAGFTIRRRYGDWDRSPIAETSPELIVVAERQ